jgi:hypothetical protein
MPFSFGRATGGWPVSVGQVGDPAGAHGVCFPSRSHSDRTLESGRGASRSAELITPWVATSVRLRVSITLVTSAA